MADYWISFRIGEVANSDERHSALVKDLQGDLSRKFWAETTSFYLVETPLDIATLTGRLASHLNSKYDTLLVRNLDRLDARYFGKVEYDPTLRKFMPYAKKL